MKGNKPNGKLREIKLPGGCQITYRRQESHDIDIHCHDAVQVIIPLEEASFELTWSLESAATDAKFLTAGDLCIIPPLLEHSACWAAAHFVNIYMPTRFIHEATRHAYDKEEQIFAELIGINDPFMFQLGAAIRQQVLLPKADNFKYYDAVLVVLANYLLNNCTINQAKPVLFNSIDHIPCEKIRDAIRYISDNLDKSLSVEDIANNIGMSQYHFMRVFKEMVGISPAKFHIRQRIEKAKALLKKNRAIAGIAYDLGFSSQSHFSNVFAKSTGTTPQKFQQRASQH